MQGRNQSKKSSKSDVSTTASQKEEGTSDFSNVQDSFEETSARCSETTPDRSTSLDITTTPSSSSSVVRSPDSTIVTDSGKKRRLQVISSEWDCVFSKCNGYLTLVGFVDESGEKTVTSCHCSSAASRGFGDCSAKYLIAKFVTSCKLCKSTVRPVSQNICMCT